MDSKQIKEIFTKFNGMYFKPVDCISKALHDTVAVVED